MAPHPLAHKKIVHKRTKKFIRFQSDRFMRVPESWRKPHGIDSPIRHQYRGNRPLVKIGYRSDRATRYMLPNGYFKHTISRLEELKAFTMQSKSYAIEIAHSVSARKRQVIVAEAKKLGIRVLNIDARVRKEES